MIYQIKVTFLLHCHLLFHDHDQLRACVIGSQNLNQLGVVKTVHQFNFLAGRLPVLGGPGSVELPGTLLARLFVGQTEHLAKLPTGNITR